MKSSLVQLSVPLSHLVPSLRDPRKVKPSRQSHACLVAMIQAYGLLQPLVVRPVKGKPKHYEVIAGHRRLRALREIHRTDGDPRIPCVLRDVDTDTAAALSLGENFAREAMHPLDEAEAFAALATSDGKDAKAISAEFGVTDRYVRQRMKLAELAVPIKKAYREGKLDTATAEAFAAVPEERQNQIWQEMGGGPRHAQHVHNIIAHNWIDAAHAMFDVTTLPASAVSSDLFSERVLIERQAFMSAQTEALATERTKLIEDGWHEVVAGRYEDVRDRLMAMDTPEREFDEQTGKKLEKLAERRAKLEAKFNEISEDDEKALAAVQEKFDAVEAEEQQLEREAPVVYSEATKAVATAFLALLEDGQVRREFRVPRARSHRSDSNANHAASGTADHGQPQPPTCNDLGDKQLAVTFTHHAIAVREALLKNAPARKRVLAMILHERVRSEALSLRHEANGTTLCATEEGFSSAAFDGIKQKRAKLDPFADQQFIEDCPGYQRLGELSASKLDALIDLLTVEGITAHLQRRTELVHILATELKVNIRDHWRPDAAWLSGFQKIQLAHLITELLGPVHAPAPERKKSELVDSLAKLFTDAAEGKLEDKQLAQRVNAWLPANLLPTKEDIATVPSRD